MDTYKTIFHPTDRQSWVMALPFLLWCLGADSRGVAESIQTSWSHQSTIMEPKVRPNYNFLLLHLGVKGAGNKRTESLTGRLSDVFIVSQNSYNL